jgi:ATP-dependent RNA helicase DeaD
LDSFAELPLSPALQRAIQDLGYEKPSPIQAAALPILLNENTDFIGLAATGTGKTAAFSLPLLERIDPKEKGVQALILCPTRELSLQVAGQVDLFGKHLGIRALPIYGGAGYHEQLAGLKKGMPIVVGTPGRIIDHINRGTLQLAGVRIAVLDEADEMISMGFREDIEIILGSIARDQRRTWLFTATMSPMIRKIADEFLKNPKSVQVNRTEMVPSTVEQRFYMTHEKNKPEVLCKLIDAAEEFYGLVFCQTKNLVVDLTRYLGDRGYKVDCLHGDMSQNAREISMARFRKRQTTIMICTDVASRGLDVKDVTHVINYSLPRELDNYVHRIGRTGRSGKAGLAMALVTPSHRHLIQKIERMTKIKLSEGTVPTRKDIGTKKISQMLAAFTDQPDYARAQELMDESWKNAVSKMTAEEVAARFLALTFPWVFAEKPRPEMVRTPATVTDKPVKSAGSKQERRDDKRHGKRDFRKKFTKGFQKNRSHGRAKPHEASRKEW